MELSQAIETRRSVRRYKKEVPSDGLIRQCIEAACYAPSAHNSQPWKFAVVKEKEMIEALSKTRPYSTFLSNAPVVIVALAEEAKSPKFWLQDLSLAIMLLMLKAHSLGLGTCWAEVFEPGTQEGEDHVRKVLDIPSKYRVLANISLGFPDERLGKKNVKSFEEATLSLQ